MSADNKPIFTNLSLGVERGEKIAIIGRSGAGKTSLLRTISGLLEPETGSVLIKGIEASSIPRDELFKDVGVVLQDSWLFAGTIRENLTLGYEDFDDEKVVKALNDAGANFLGENKIDMLEFPILDRGSNLSEVKSKSYALQEHYYKSPQFCYLMKQQVQWILRWKLHF